MLLLFNATIYTLDQEQPVAPALVVDQGRVIAMGDRQDLRFEFGGRAKDLDLGGKIVIPGLTDAHLHLKQYALSLTKVDCETTSRFECLARVQERARQLPPGEWVLGHGWNQNDWPEGFGCAADLDGIVPNHPVYLTAKSLHAGWANSAALRRANISAATPDPPGGRLGRDERGTPDGILFEQAMELVSQVVPQPEPEVLAQAILEALPALWRLGLTGVHDFDRRLCFVALQLLHQRGELRLRVLKSIPQELLPLAAELGLRTGFGDDFLRIGGVKIFADGALGPHTAATLAPYQDDPGNVGMLIMDMEQILEVGRLAVGNGLSLAVHAIGDRANRVVLDALERLRAFERQRLSGGSPALRHRIEHVQLIHPDDAARLAQLGVIASMQPLHAVSDMEMADRYWGARAANSYAWRTQLDNGAALAFGSDAPVDPLDPFGGLHAAVTRRRIDGAPGPDGWYPQQRLSVEQALRAYTLGPAYAAGMENRLGRLVPGYLADLLVLGSDPFTCPPEELPMIRPLATMIAGDWVFQA